MENWQRHQIYFNATYIIQAIASGLILSTLMIMWSFWKYEYDHIIILQAIVCLINGGIIYLQVFLRSTMIAKRLF